MTKFYLSSLLATALLAFGGGNVQAQSDVTDTYINNPGFEEGTAVSANVRTYAKDKATGETSGLNDVTNWTKVEDGDSKAAGVFTYGSDYYLGGQINNTNTSAPTSAPDGGGNNTLGIVAVWGATAQYKQEAKQSLAPGSYTLTVKVYNSVGGTLAPSKDLFGFVTSDGTEYLAKSEAYTVNSWTTKTVTFTLKETTTGYFSIGYTAKSGNSGFGNAAQPHLFYDNITLTYEAFATASDYNTLSSALSSAKTKQQSNTLGFEAGEYAPYNNADIINAISAADGITEENITSYAKSYIDDLVATLNEDWTDNTEEVNAVNDGYFKTAAITTTSGEATDELEKLGWTRNSSWTSNNSNGLRVIYDNTRTDNGKKTGAGLADGEKAVFMWGGVTAEYGATEGYTMPLKANTVYQLSFDYAGWTGPNNENSTYSLLDANSNGIAKTNLAAGKAASETFTSVKRVFKTGAEAGNYVFQFTANGNSSIKNIDIIKAEAVTLAEDASAAPEANSSAYVKMSRSFKQGWNSIVLPFDVTADELTNTLGASEAAEYKGTTTTDNTTTISFSKVTELKANVPYLLYFDEDKTVEAEFVDKNLAPAETTTSTGGDYEFVGTYTANPTISEGDYIVVSKGIQKAKGGNALKAFRAYLKKASSTGTSAKNVVLVIDDNTISTGINAVNAESVSDGNIYNVAGQKVSNSYKGLVIKNGKKFLNK